MHYLHASEAHLTQLALVYPGRVQVLWQVNEEAAFVAVETPFGGAEGVQHQGPRLALRAGGDTLAQEAVLAADMGAHCARHASLGRPGTILQHTEAWIAIINSHTDMI